MTDAAKPYPLITEAIRRGDLDAVDALLHRYPEILTFRVPGFGGWLHYTAAHGTLEIAQYLVSLGLDVNGKDKHGEQTPLTNAAHSGHTDIAAYLLSCGAVLDTSSSALNPLFSAIVGRSVAFARLLLDAGIDLKASYAIGSLQESVDAVAFAMLRGEKQIARLIALRNSRGNEIAAQAAMAEGLRVAQAIAIAA